MECVADVIRRGQHRWYGRVKTSDELTEVHETDCKGLGTGIV